MNIQISSVNNNQIVIDNYQVNTTQAYQLRVVGLVMNASTNQVIIDCGRPVTREDIVKVQRYLRR